MHRVALRISQRSLIEPLISATDATIKGWLPGKHSTELTMKSPQTLAAGDYEIAVGIVDSQMHKPAVRLGIEGRDSSGWYPVSRVTVRK